MPDDILEPPGSIAILGANLRGLEAAIYGRFLGYDVHVFDPRPIGKAWADRGEAPLPFLPGRGMSELALKAIAAQTGEDDSLQTLPMTCSGWAEHILRPLAQVDLLRGRIHEVAIQSIERVPNEEDPTELDFRIRGEGMSESWEVEAVVDTMHCAADICDPASLPAEQLCPVDADGCGFATKTAYFYSIDTAEIDTAEPTDWEAHLQSGRAAIRDLYAMLGDRPTLDLYRPRRM